MVEDIKLRVADPPRQGELVSVQYLRGMASLFVVSWHACGEVHLKGWTFLNSGIEVFFLVSGFVIWTISAERPPSPGLFLKKRLARVVPFYWAVTTATVVMLLIRPSLAQTLILDPAHVLASYLFIPWTNPTPGVGIRPLVIPGWTLNYELLFYVAFAGVLFLPRRWRGATLVAAMTALPVLGPLVGGTSAIGAFYTSPLTVEIGFGVLLALVTIRHDPPPALAALLLAAGVVLTVVGGTLWDGGQVSRLVMLCLPMAMVLVGAVALDRAGHMPTWRLPKALGDASYSLYMIHPLMLSAMAQVWRHAGASLPGWMFVVLSLVATSAVGVGVHHLVEKPLTEALQRGLKLSRPRTPKPSRLRQVLTRLVKNPSEVV